MTSTPNMMLLENRHYLPSGSDQRDEEFFECCYFIDIIFENSYDSYNLYKKHNFSNKIKYDLVDGKKIYYATFRLYDLFNNDSEELIKISKYFKVIDIRDKSECLKETNGYTSKHELIETLQEYYIPIEERNKKQITKRNV